MRPMPSGFMGLPVDFEGWWTRLRQHNRILERAIMGHIGYGRAPPAHLTAEKRSMKTRLTVIEMRCSESTRSPPSHRRREQLVELDAPHYIWHG
jgi:hypothetical protein